MENAQLIKLAAEAAKNARCDITGFRVGAALLCKNGKVFTGCNIEDPSGIGITNICAERCAIVKALSEGSEDFLKIAVIGGENELRICAPCGACRQYLMSWCPDIAIVLGDGKSPPGEYTLSGLLPLSFSLPGG